ncbi:hypothetical protein P872_25495 [Rhodonellum psychrophilum GCM71 = DSM 17998]|uniref:Uncharacterized protein n=1 Tax=Rhodonellum psychrophilum GCM71 = DSM 17998 TaxID=1123057 RepID=U5C3X7_9BACT|nr:hypothetical protein P872_25495 [Rhodonellum psychrophilum GCM71 = DSM 17998]
MGENMNFETGDYKTANQRSFNPFLAISLQEVPKLC